MKRIIRGFLEQSDYRFWGIGLILVLFAVLSLAWEMPGAVVKHASPPVDDPVFAVPAVLVFQQVTATPTAEPLATPTQTPLPAELLANYQQTTGIIIFAGVVVLIIVSGVFFQLIKDRTPL
jgi:hypothetical protein